MPRESQTSDPANTTALAAARLPAISRPDGHWCQVMRDATAIAGDRDDLLHRALGYRLLYRQSGGRFVFPLLAAHGAVWGDGYMSWGLRAAKLLSVRFLGRPGPRGHKLHALHHLAAEISAVHRDVFIGAYTAFHATRAGGGPATPVTPLGPELADWFGRLHLDREQGIGWTDAEKRAFYRAFFLWEQDHVVGDRVIIAARAVDWGWVRALALRPMIHFAYFKPWERLVIRNFADRGDRLATGLQAFDIAARLGWRRTENSLDAVLTTRTGLFSGQTPAPQLAMTGSPLS